MVTMPALPAKRRRLILAAKLFAGLGLVLLVSAAVTWHENVEGRTSANPADYEPPPEGMVLVPAGYFWMGSDDPKAEGDEHPKRRVWLPAFYIDRLEVSNREYKKFKPTYQYPAGEDDLPVTFIFKPEAEAYASWARRRLPTNAEWEKAARGTDGRIYPWGDTFEVGRSNLKPPGSAPATNPAHCVANSRGKVKPGSFPSGASPYGCEDMAGNVWEWVSDVYHEKGWFGWIHPDQGRGIIRGGAYGYSSFQGRSSYQAFEALTTTCHDVGFRCVMDAIPKERD